MDQFLYLLSLAMLCGLGSLFPALIFLIARMSKIYDGSLTVRELALAREKCLKVFYRIWVGSTVLAMVFLGMVDLYPYPV